MTVSTPTKSFVMTATIGKSESSFRFIPHAMNRPIVMVMRELPYDQSQLSPSYTFEFFDQQGNLAKATINYNDWNSAEHAREFWRVLVSRGYHRTQ